MIPKENFNCPIYSICKHIKCTESCVNYRLQKKYKYNKIKHCKTIEKKFYWRKHA